MATARMDLNERVEAKALYTARDYLYDLVKTLAG